MRDEMIIDGKEIAAAIQEEVRREVAALPGRKPCLAFLLVGEDPASKIYINRKAKACEELGIRSLRYLFSEETSEGELLMQIAELNSDPEVDAILVQLPLPSQISAGHILCSVDPQKDVDGFHPINLGKLLAGDEDGFFPCTPLGIVTLLAHSGIEVEGQHVVVVGRSNIVGKPVAALLMQKRSGANATVTVAHSASRNLATVIRSGDILIAAAGRPHLITAAMVREGAVVVDVGINKLPDSKAPKGYRLVGDVAFEEVKRKCSKITPVPGGVGPMTIAMLMSNTLKSFKRRAK